MKSHQLLTYLQILASLQDFIINKKLRKKKNKVNNESLSWLTYKNI